MTGVAGMAVVPMTMVMRMTIMGMTARGTLNQPPGRGGHGTTRSVAHQHHWEIKRCLIPAILSPVGDKFHDQEKQAPFDKHLF